MGRCRISRREIELTTCQTQAEGRRTQEGWRAGDRWPEALGSGLLAWGSDECSLWPLAIDCHKNMPGI